MSAELSPQSEYGYSSQPVGSELAAVDPHQPSREQMLEFIYVRENGPVELSRAILDEADQHVAETSAAWQESVNYYTAKLAAAKHGQTECRAVANRLLGLLEELDGVMGQEYSAEQLAHTYARWTTPVIKAKEQEHLLVLAEQDNIEEEQIPAVTARIEELQARGSIMELNHDDPEIRDRQLAYANGDMDADEKELRLLQMLETTIGSRLYELRVLDLKIPKDIQKANDAIDGYHASALENRRHIEELKAELYQLRKQVLNLALPERPQKYSTLFDGWSIASKKSFFVSLSIAGQHEKALELAMQDVDSDEILEALSKRELQAQRPTAAPAYSQPVSPVSARPIAPPATSTVTHSRITVESRTEISSVPGMPNAMPPIIDGEEMFVANPVTSLSPDARSRVVDRAINGDRYPQAPTAPASRPAKPVLAVSGPLQTSKPRKILARWGIIAESDSIKQSRRP